MTYTDTHHNIRSLRAAARGGANVADEMRRLMPRDRWLIDLLGQHRVFTTEQITTLAFTNLHTARNRLVLLNSRGILARFRNAVRPGSQQWRWTLDLLGEVYLASRAGQGPPQFTTIRTKINKLAASPQLDHRLAVNDLFVELIGHARTTPDAALSAWWSAKDCTKLTGDLIRPDGYGDWTEEGQRITFWFEQDQGTEKTHRVIAKLGGYQAFLRATSRRDAILFRLCSPRAEKSFQARLAEHPAIVEQRLLVATTSGDAHPAAAIWQPAATTRRVRLAQLADLAEHVGG
ncbi:MAG TPA: replication-relaxation family protein [Candidatus Limnocylindrales bacterium]|nr:replication-relaxation family protein [Candidatus Limnocylindrales bacterium]